ncbi:MAG TPA: iron-sulfur cluster assembly protein [Bacteroidales bacterium]|nr:iron-sulfur cluster assembly protein [Bacteroidales bacterium]HNS47801.1 iron-sulfur cluster assembly protein [Bacteroidales bacterium]
MNPTPLSNEEKAVIEQLIIRELKTVFDPEIPVNIYDLGLVYDILVDDKRTVYIKMTLTAPSCPVAESLPVEVSERIRKLDSVSGVKVEVVFDPPWSRDMISQEGLLEMGFL